MVSKEQQDKNLKAFEAALAAIPLGAPTTIPLSDVYSFSDIFPKHGQWYFGGRCEDCGNDVPIIPDKSSGALGNPFTGPGSIKADCFYCSGKASAKSSDIRSFEWKAE